MLLGCIGYQKLHISNLSPVVLYSSTQIVVFLCFWLPHFKSDQINSEAPSRVSQVSLLEFLHNNIRIYLS